ncbi:MAG: exostosin family protein [Nitrospiraceae bacterium]|nr:MAG: exostosin family protein [Nitrospiraceae bacterium]
MEISVTDRTAKVYLYTDPSCDTAEGRWTGLRRLRELYDLSDKKHLLTNDPDEADIILYGDVMEKNWTMKILNSRLLRKYPHKCFSVSWHDRPYFLSHGIYSGNYRSVLSCGRVRTGAYTTDGDKFRNPFIKNHCNSVRDYANKDYLFSFIGRDSHHVRKAVFNLKCEREDALIEDSSTFDLWRAAESTRHERQQYFYEILLRSKFSLCPRGSAPNSIRLFESMRLGVAPVIISDEWVPPIGPKWNEFAVIIREKDIGDLVKIVEAHEDRYKEMGQSAKTAYDEYFAERVYFNYIVSNCIDILNRQRIPESICLALSSLLLKSRIQISTAKDRLRCRTRLREFFSRVCNR